MRESKSKQEYPPHPSQQLPRKLNLFLLIVVKFAEHAG